MMVAGPASCARTLGMPILGQRAIPPRWGLGRICGAASLHSSALRRERALEIGRAITCAGCGHRMIPCVVSFASVPVRAPACSGCGGHTPRPTVPSSGPARAGRYSHRSEAMRSIARRRASSGRTGSGLADLPLALANTSLRSSFLPWSGISLAQRGRTDVHSTRGAQYGRLIHLARVEPVAVAGREASIYVEPLL